MGAPSSPGGALKGASGLPSPLDTAINWPKHRRLLHRPEFRAAYEQGMRRSSPHFTVFGVAARRAADRFGITVSRKLGGAVVRNRLRRRTRELLRRLPPAAGPACDIVINPRPTVATADFRRLGEELAATLDQLRRAVHTPPAAPERR